MATMNIEEKTFEGVKKALTKLASLARDARRSTEKSDMESVLELIETELQEIRDVLLIEAEPSQTRADYGMETGRGHERRSCVEVAAPKFLLVDAGRETRPVHSSRRDRRIREAL